MADPGSDEAAIEQEIRQEKARSLGKAGEALEQACAQAWEAYRALSPGDREAAGAYVLAHREARERLHNLVLQREAMGLFGHRDVDRCYPLPPKPDSTATRGG
jgi:DNA-binding TFAR19-related protein (PDSD5 family)